MGDESKFVIIIGCRACGERHAVTFADQKEFHALRCRSTGEPVFSKQGYAKVWAEFQADLFDWCASA